MLIRTCCLVLLVAAPAFAFEPATVPTIRSVCNYLFEEDEFDLDIWARDLDGMKAQGFNTVWVVNVWAAFQPDVAGEFRSDRLEWLRGLCKLSSERNMNVLLVAGYIGEGWGPRGVDVPVWPIVPAHRDQYCAYLRWLAGGVAEFENVVYLLCSEEILPATLLYTPDTRPECVTQFRQWARETNPDMAYWNARWDTNYTWDDLRPAPVKERRTWQTWLDVNRWFASLMNQLLPPMTAAIRAGDPDAVIGFHDFLLSPELPLEVADMPRPQECGFDFYSIGYYYVHRRSYEQNTKALTSRAELAAEFYPDLPRFCGELGLPVRNDHVEADEQLQALWYAEALEYLREQGMGWSVWSWRTVVKRAPNSLALLRSEDKSPRPSLELVRQANIAGADRQQPRAGPARQP